MEHSKIRRRHAVQGLPSRHLKFVDGQAFGVHAVGRIVRWVARRTHGGVVCVILVQLGDGLVVFRRPCGPVVARVVGLPVRDGGRRHPNEVVAFAREGVFVVGRVVCGIVVVRLGRNECVVHVIDVLVCTEQVALRELVIDDEVLDLRTGATVLVDVRGGVGTRLIVDGHRRVVDEILEVVFEDGVDLFVGQLDLNSGVFVTGKAACEGAGHQHKNKQHGSLHGADRVVDSFEHDSEWAVFSETNEGHEPVPGA